MARLQIIALTKTLDAGRTSWNLAFWYDVPASRQKFFARPTATSAWLDAQPADVAALQSGSVYEELVTYSPDAVQGAAAIEAGAAALWTAKNAVFQASNPWGNYGTTFDGATWNLVVVA